MGVSPSQAPEHRRSCRPAARGLSPNALPFPKTSTSPGRVERQGEHVVEAHTWV